MHILILEPDRVLAGQMASFFELAGHTAAIHSDPQAAVNSMDQQRPDIIITELELAGRSGVEFLYELRSYPEWLDIPAIIYTSLPADQAAAYQQIFKQLNIKAYLAKSLIGLAGLASQVDSLLPTANAKV